MTLPIAVEEIGEEGETKIMFSHHVEVQLTQRSVYYQFNVMIVSYDQLPLTRKFAGA